MERAITTKRNKKKLLIALEQTLGIITSACKICNLSRDTFYYYYRNDAEFKGKVDDLDEFVMDFVENALFKAIKEGDSQAIQFYMKYKGKKRGYINSSDLTSNGQTIGPQVIKVIVADDEEEKE